MRRAFQSLILVVFVAAVVRGEVIRQPLSLGAGDHYRLAFITSEGRTARSRNIESYNDFVQAVADAAPIGEWGLEWKAIAGTATVTARENTSTDPVTDPSVPIFLLDGTVLAPSYSALWNAETDTLPWPFDVNEFGNDFFSIESPILGVWTGTGPDGLPHLLQNDEGGPLGEGIRSNRGLADHDTSSTWFTAGSAPHNRVQRMYAISNVLTAVPEPSNRSYLLTLVALLLVVRKRTIQNRH